ncbi:hypothetical protein Vadar_017137 [Vaccinium darrowii]|uniref:Uncharacterized protein n=1 Tax=Vaccinium darrowii TaxID=229202 RepID=A0ACB7YM52_9ERIC|nr:hypothetical protein Vadar_017137 [Vaccinium darrowii]
MEHLPIHLVEEAKIGGPVRYWWMYYVERYLMTLKSYVSNRARPEGSIVEGYFVEECMTFCSRYLDDVESKLNQPMRNYDGGDEGQVGGRPLGKEEKFSLSLIQKAQDHHYILFNTDSVIPYREKNWEFIRQNNRRLRDRALEHLHHETFPIWFQNYVHQLQLAGPEQVTEEIADLALGPRDTATRFSGYIINGVRYHTKDRERKRKTQNSGVVLMAKTSSYSSARDVNPQEGDVTYYGRITDLQIGLRAIWVKSFSSSHASGKPELSVCLKNDRIIESGVFGTSVSTSFGEASTTASFGPTMTKAMDRRVVASLHCTMCFTL